MATLPSSAPSSAFTTTSLTVMLPLTMHLRPSMDRLQLWQVGALDGEQGGQPRQGLGGNEVWVQGGKGEGSQGRARGAMRCGCRGGTGEGSQGRARGTMRCGCQGGGEGLVGGGPGQGIMCHLRGQAVVWLAARPPA